MYSKRKMIWYTFILAAGIVLIVLSCIGTLDSFWSGFGGGIAAVGLVRLINGVKYRRDPGLAKQMDVSQKDERVSFIAIRARAWAFHISALGSAAAVLVLKLMGSEELAMCVSLVLCGMLVVYSAVFAALQRRY